MSDSRRTVPKNVGLLAGDGLRIGTFNSGGGGFRPPTTVEEGGGSRSTTVRSAPLNPANTNIATVSRDGVSSNPKRARVGPAPAETATTTTTAATETSATSTTESRPIFHVYVVERGTALKLEQCGDVIVHGDVVNLMASDCASVEVRGNVTRSLTAQRCAAVEVHGSVETMEARYCTNTLRGSVGTMNTCGVIGMQMSGAGGVIVNKF